MKWLSSAPLVRPWCAPTGAKSSSSEARCRSSALTRAINRAAKSARAGMAALPALAGGMAMEDLEQRQMLSVTPPVLTIDAPHTTNEGSVFAVNLSASGAGAATLDHWTLNWGDGSAAQTVLPDPVTGLFPASVAHTYPDGPGDLRVTASATNADGTFPASLLDTSRNGALDSTFGTGGKVTTSITAEGDHATAVQADGKIITVGASYSDFSVTRYNANGTLDSTFGVGGKVTTDFGDMADIAYAVTIQSDGKIVVAGRSCLSNYPYSDVYYASVARYNTDGSLDTSFGPNGDGKFTTYNVAAGGGATLKAVTIDTSGTPATNANYGKIVVAGTDLSSDGHLFLVGRLNANGTADSTFGTGGFTAVKYSSYYTSDDAYAVVVEGDGKIIAGGTTNYFAGVVRLNSNGSVDTTYGSNNQGWGSAGWYYGYDVNDYGGSSKVDALALDANGNVVAGGIYDDNWGVFRLNSTGTLDSSFGTGGVTTGGPASTANEVAGLVLQGDGKILAVGSSIPPGFGTSDFAVARYNANGTPDTSFGPNGTGQLTTDFGSNDQVVGAAVTPDGRLIVAGFKALPGNTYFTALAGYDLGLGDALHVNNVAPTVSLGTDVIITEANAFTATNAFVDPGADTWTAIVNYGDGTGNLPLTLNADKTFSLNHLFTDGGHTYTVTVTVTDKDGGVGVSTMHVIDNNAAPTPTIVTPSSANEGSAASVSFTAVDSPGDLAAGFTARWSYTFNGVTSATTTNTGGYTFTPTDNGVYTINLTLTDRDGLAATTSTPLTVSNVAPTATALSGATNTSTGHGVRGQTLNFSSAWSDPGSNEAVQVAWDFGDGTTIAYHPVTDSGALTPSYSYDDTGTYAYSVTFKDKDGGVSTSRAGTMNIYGAEIQADPIDPSKTALQVGGTPGNDTIYVTAVGSQYAGVTISGVSQTNPLNLTTTFAPTNRIVVHGWGGNDTIVVANSLNSGLYQELSGDSGNDYVQAGSGAAVVLGDAGNDTVVSGSNGRDILIGGDGADTITGYSNDQVIISGYTVWDFNTVALSYMIKEWGRTDLAFSSRQAHLAGSSGGYNNGYYFQRYYTVVRDSYANTLTSGAGNDWYWYSTSDSISDYNASLDLKSLE